MKKILKLFLMAVCLCIVLSACSASQLATEPSVGPGLEFAEGQYYAVAYLGYEDMSSLADYAQTYLSGSSVPVFHISGGEYYLVIPRYEDMKLELYVNELEPQQSILLYESEMAHPFVLQCNISDIFPNCTIRFSREGSQIEFSPYQSLMDGSLQIGPHGLDITAAN